MAIRIQVRRDTAANWASANPVLADGEPGYVKDTRELKFGDGTTAWNDLPFFIAKHERGDWNASGGTYPASGGSGDDGSIKKWDKWIVTTAGVLAGEAADEGTILMALADDPGQTDSNWRAI